MMECCSYFSYALASHKVRSDEAAARTKTGLSLFPVVYFQPSCAAINGLGTLTHRGVKKRVIHSREGDQLDVRAGHEVRLSTPPPCTCWDIDTDPSYDPTHSSTPCRRVARGGTAALGKGAGGDRTSVWRASGHVRAIWALAADQLGASVPLAHTLYRLQRLTPHRRQS
ncbi:hypothetical protein E2C01_007408 [Portunus trituberculatus]|uniref:Uncharacterized protein n=1 Tax=Portunus trituberculatus TaxID=210409 RepID=A0A5B7CZD9_PORTR|nr:hypothetical protein [Portunus trituberculatus]